MTHPDRDLEDVNAHLTAIHLIANAANSDARLEDQIMAIAYTSDPQHGPRVVRYLACYAASLLRRLREHQALPSEPDEYLADIGALVAATVPRPE